MKLSRRFFRKKNAKTAGARNDSAGFQTDTPPGFHSNPAPAWCRFRKLLDSSVSMVELAKNRMRNNVSEPLDRACAGRILPERNVNSHFIMGLRGIEWVILGLDTAESCAFPRHFASPLGFESSINVGWHEQRSEGGGCGMHICSPVFDRNRQCAAFSVIRKRA
jgi:hypothetical protein